MALPAIVRALCSPGGYSVFGVILLMTAHTPAHREWVAAASDCHRLHITMTIATNLLHWLALLKIKTLNMALVMKTHEIGQVMHLLPGNRLLRFPIFEQFLDAWRFPYRLDALMAADALLRWRDTCRHTAARIRVAIHAIDLHAALSSVTGVAIMGKLNRLINLGSQIVSSG